VALSFHSPLLEQAENDTGGQYVLVCFGKKMKNKRRFGAVSSIEPSAHRRIRVSFEQKALLVY
jgi:hypothetical protein